MCERAASDFHRGKKSNFRVLEVAVPGRARHHKGVVVRALSFRSKSASKVVRLHSLICGAFVVPVRCNFANGGSYIFIDVAMRWVHPVLGLELQAQLSWLAERLPVYMVYTRSH